MNCKPGDMAIHLRSGAIVNVLRPHTNKQEIFRSVEGDLYRFMGSGPSWVCEFPGSPHRYEVPGWPATGQHFRIIPILDSSLRPIRDADGDDETFTWAGKPNNKEVCK